MNQKVIPVLLLIIALGSPLVAETPTVTLQEWKDSFAKNPEWFEKGVHVVDAPRKSFVATGRVQIASIRFKTGRDREVAGKLAELAAKRELLDHVYARDKKDLRLPERLATFTNEDIQQEGYRRSLTVSGLQVAASWVDEGFLWCTVIVSHDGIDGPKRFVEQTESAGADHWLREYERQKTAQALYKAFECDHHSKAVRGALSKRFADQGQHVAAFLIIQAGTLPAPDDPLGQYLGKTGSEHLELGLRHFRAEVPDLEKALPEFLLALNSQYTNPETLNYVGVCFQRDGWHRLSALFFEQALMQSKDHLHPYALTNLGISQSSLGEVESARRSLTKAIQAFPNHSWTKRAQEALSKLDLKPSSIEGAVPKK